ncbi:MAG: class I SAM-dependent methyltransferase [Planctomycetota bacterium]
MPSIEENRKLWNEEFSWKQQGDEWSRYWGTTDLQWYATLLPRIHTFVPTPSILEIAPGFGRWTQYLKNLTQHLSIVDLSEKCIQACQQRFSKDSHISYYVNNGRSLEMIPDGSIDFVFSFDSLVHAEDEVIESYLKELACKFTDEGIGFIHHSNLGSYSTYYHYVKKIPALGKRILAKAGWQDVQDHWRAQSMTAEKFQQFAQNAGLCCIRQECVNWGSKRMIDCFSIFTRRGSKWVTPNQIFRNRHFMKEAATVTQLAQIYSSQTFGSL